MSAQGPYSRVYHALVDDPDFADVYDDDAAFATWVRLLMLGDASYPTAPPLPRWVKRRCLAKLRDCGLLELLPGERFRVKGLEAERGRRAALARRAALVRHGSTSSADAMQTQSGRSADAMPRRDETRKDKTSNGANAQEDRPFMRYRPRASVADIAAQEREAWERCADCSKLRRQHPTTGDHLFRAEQGASA